MSSVMLCLCLITITMVTTTSGCSPPIGGFVAPTPAKTVHGAQYVLRGIVTSKLDPDPLHRLSTDSYGAEVKVHCTYKGGPLPATITIGGAGAIPGLCVAKHLVQGTEYLIFLGALESGTVYEQSASAKPVAEIANYMDVCGLELVYPPVNRWKYRKKVQCPKVKKAGTCQQYEPTTGNTSTVTITANP